MLHLDPFLLSSIIKIKAELLRLRQLGYLSLIITLSVRHPSLIPKSPPMAQYKCPPELFLKIQYSKEAPPPVVLTSWEVEVNCKPLICRSSKCTHLPENLPLAPSPCMVTPYLLLPVERTITSAVPSFLPSNSIPLFASRSH